MTYASVVLADAPVAWYRLGEASGTSAADSSGNALNATIAGTPTLNQPSLVNDANGSIKTVTAGSDYVLTPSSASLELGTTGSVEVWIKATAATGVVFRPASNVGYMIWISSTTANIRLAVGAGDFDSGVPASAILDNAPHHMVLAWDSTSYAFYVDGLSKSTGTRSAAISGQQWYLSKNGTFGNNDLAATLDEWALYGTKLSATQVSNHYSAGVPAPTVAPVVTGIESNGAVYLLWPRITFAASYDVNDGTTTTNVTNPYAYLTGYTNGVAKSFTVTAKNQAGSGPASSSVSVTPTADVLLFDTFDRTANPPGAPNYGPTPTVQSNIQTNGSALIPATSAAASIIWDVTTTDNLEMIFCLATDSFTSSLQDSYLGWFLSYTDTNNHMHVELNPYRSSWGDLWESVSGTAYLLESTNLRTYNASTYALTNPTVGDVFKILLVDQKIAIYINNVLKQTFVINRARFTASKLGLYFNSTASYSVDYIRVKQNASLPTVAGGTKDIKAGSSRSNVGSFVYRGRANKTSDSGSVA